MLYTYFQFLNHKNISANSPLNGRIQGTHCKNDAIAYETQIKITYAHTHKTEYDEPSTLQVLGLPSYCDSSTHSC